MLGWNIYVFVFQVLAKVGYSWKVFNTCCTRFWWKLEMVWCCRLSSAVWQSALQCCQCCLEWYFMILDDKRWDTVSKCQHLPEQWRSLGQYQPGVCRHCSTYFIVSGPGTWDTGCRASVRSVWVRHAPILSCSVFSELFHLDLDIFEWIVNILKDWTELVSKWTV